MAVQFTRIAVKIGSNVLARKDGTLDVTRIIRGGSFGTQRDQTFQKIR